jgi:hypothetical protein
MNKWREKEKKKKRRKYKDISYSGSKQRLGDGGSILGRGVVRFRHPKLGRRKFILE